ncbi:MAG: FAD-dependent thymidylate synthase [Candidatus Heimdallarchaeota archaeon]
MKIIEQSHEILRYDSISMVETSGRTCYRSQDKIGCTTDKFENCLGEWNEKKTCIDSDCQYHSSRKFVKMIKDRGHHAMLEFGDIAVKFITNRGVTHELVRHRLANFAQESSRYVKYDGDMEFIKPVWVSNDLNHLTAAESLGEFLFVRSCNDAEINYSSLLTEGWRPEQAREVLPNSLKTEIIVKANFREWMHILKLRCSPKSHPQMVALMLPLLKELHDKIPIIFDDLYDKYLGKAFPKYKSLQL